MVERRFHVPARLHLHIDREDREGSRVDRQSHINVVRLSGEFAARFYASASYRPLLLLCQLYTATAAGLSLKSISTTVFLRAFSALSIVLKTVREM